MRVSSAYGRDMLGSHLLGQSATLVGLLAGSIAVGGFLGHAGPSLSGKPDSELRRDTTLGGLIGMGLAITVVVLSVSVNLLS